jgi:hypothetical protein
MRKRNNPPNTSHTSHTSHPNSAHMIKHLPWNCPDAEPYLLPFTPNIAVPLLFSSLSPIPRAGSPVPGGPLCRYASEDGGRPDPLRGSSACGSRESRTRAVRIGRSPTGPCPSADREVVMRPRTGEGRIRCADHRPAGQGNPGQGHPGQGRSGSDSR